MLTGPQSSPRENVPLEPCARSPLTCAPFTGLFAIIVALNANSAIACPDQPLRVAVDIGHSQFDPGAISATGKFEYAFNHRFAQELVAHADTPQHAQLDLFILNPKRRKLKLRQRTSLAADKNADVFISIHHDSVNKKYIRTWTHDGNKRQYSDTFSGFSLFVSERNVAFKRARELAEMIGRSFKEAGIDPSLHHAEPIKGENRKLLSAELGVYDVPFAVLASASMTAVLLELGIIVNRAEEKKLETQEHRAKLRAAILRALKTFCAT